MTVDHPAWCQVLIGPLDSEEQHHKTGGQQLPEEQDDPEHHIGFTIDLLCIRLVRYIIPAVIERTGPIFRRKRHHDQVITGSGGVEQDNYRPDGCGLAY